MNELDMLLDMAARGKAVGDPYFAHMDGKAAAINYIRIANLVSSFGLRSVLDWGCGHGQVSWLLKARGIETSSCDVGRSTGAQAITELAEINVTVLDHAYRLPYASGRFDGVLSVGVLEHVPNFDESLEEIARVLKVGGLLFIFMLPNRYSWAEKIADWRGISVHPYKFTPRSASELFEKHGFTVQKAWRRNFLPRNLTGLSPLIKRLYGACYKQIEFADRVLANVLPSRALAGVHEFIVRRR